jgi:hypothetical protein
MKAFLTYQTVTPESAAQGDFDDQGWVVPGLGEFSCDDVLEEIKADDSDYVVARTVAELVSVAESFGCLFWPDAEWAYSIDPVTDYATGEEKTYSLHVEDVTPPTYRRIVRLLAGD